MAQIVPGSPRTLRRLARELAAGRLVAVPTETVYGLAAHALDAAACRQIFAVKGRPLADPLIVHVSSLREAERLAVFNDAARTLARQCWPGPLTLVLPRREGIPDVVTGGRPTVAVRVPAHPLFRRLLAACRLPLAAPSANPFGYVSPTTARHVAESLGRQIGWILDGGPCRVGVESSIVDLTRPSRPRLLRPGGLPLERIEAILGRHVRRLRRRHSPVPEAPGTMQKHYSPRTPLRLVSPATLDGLLARPPARVALLFFRRPRRIPAAVRDRVYWLSEDGSERSAARRLFDVLRRADGPGHKRLYAELPTGRQGLGLALVDRLRRAAAS